MYTKSGSKLIKTTIGIQSGPDTFKISKSVMNLLTIS